LTPRADSALIGGPPPSGKGNTDNDMNEANLPGRVFTTTFTLAGSALIGGPPPAGKDVSLRAWSGIRFPEGLFVTILVDGIVRNHHDGSCFFDFNANRRIKICQKDVATPDALAHIATV